MGIHYACYVYCDICHNPAPISIENARNARDIAAQSTGFVRRGKQDLCPNCDKEQQSHSKGPRNASAGLDEQEATGDTTLPPLYGTMEA